MTTASFRSGATLNHSEALHPYPIAISTNFKINVSFLISYYSSVHREPTWAFTPDSYDFLGNLSVSFEFQYIEIVAKAVYGQGLGSQWYPHKVLKYTSKLLAAPMCHLFNASLASVVFFDTLQRAHEVLQNSSLLFTEISKSFHHINKWWQRHFH